MGMVIEVTFSALLEDDGLGRCCHDESVVLNVPKGILFDSFHFFLLDYIKEKL